MVEKENGMHRNRQQVMQGRMRQLSVPLVLGVSVVVALLAGGVLAPRTARAAPAPAQVHVDHEQNVFADFLQIDPTGCITTAVFVTSVLSVIVDHPGDTRMVLT